MSRRRSPDHRLDLAAERGSVEQRVDEREAELRAPEDARREFEIHRLQLGGGEAEGDGGGDDRAGRGAADQVEAVGEPHRRAPAARV